MKKMLLAVVLVVVLATAGLAAYMGVFASVVIVEQDQGPFTFVYREMTGNNMKQVGELTDSISAVLSERGISLRKPLDIFSPDGHAEIGFAIEDTSFEKIAGLRGHAMVRTVPLQLCMVSRFPWRNPLSFVVGYFKVDPALQKYRLSHNYAKVAAYSLHEGETIVYIQPVKRQP